MKILKCTCPHSYQDELYGPGMRAMNETAKGTYRCTVCTKEHTAGSAPAVSAKVKVAETAAVAKAQPAAKKTPEKGKPEDKKKKASMKGGKR